MKSGRLLLCMGLTVALIGCVTERPTNPDHVPKLPATPITSVILQDTSAIVTGVGLPDSTRRFDFGTSSLFQTGEFDDIQIAFSADLSRLPAMLSVYDPARTRWGQIEGAVTASGSYLCFDRCLTNIRRLCSEVKNTSPGDFLSQDGQFRVGAHRGWEFQARLLQYAPSYHFARVLSSETFEYINLSYSRGALYLCSDHSVRGAGLVVDSLIAMDLEGNRIWNTGYDLANAYQAAYDGESFWVLGGSDGFLRNVDSLGQYGASIRAPIPYFAGMTWWKNSLWLLREDLFRSTKIFEIDIDSSLAAGVAVLVHRFDLPTSSRGLISSDSTGLIVVHDGRVHWYSETGQERRSVPSPNVWMTALASDDESLWVLHYGPQRGSTDATLLTRFTLE